MPIQAAVIFAQLLRRIALPASLQAQSRGAVQLRGREHETQLLTIINGGVDQPLIETRQ
jgi:hypothetical protein